MIKASLEFIEILARSHEQLTKDNKHSYTDLINMG